MATGQKHGGDAVLPTFEAHTFSLRELKTHQGKEIVGSAMIKDKVNEHAAPLEPTPSPESTPALLQENKQPAATLPVVQPSLNVGSKFRIDADRQMPSLLTTCEQFALRNEATKNELVVSKDSREAQIAGLRKDMTNVQHMLDDMQRRLHQLEQENANEGQENANEGIASQSDDSPASKPGANSPDNHATKSFVSEIIVETETQHQAQAEQMDTTDSDKEKETQRKAQAEQPETTDSDKETETQHNAQAEKQKGKKCNKESPILSELRLRADDHSTALRRME